MDIRNRIFEKLIVISPEIITDKNRKKNTLHGLVEFLVEGSASVKMEFLVHPNRKQAEALSILSTKDCGDCISKENLNTILDLLLSNYNLCDKRQYEK